MKVLMSCLLILSAAACSSLSANPESVRKEQVYGAQIGIVNHTGQFIYSAIVGGGGGGNAYPYSAGVPNICCAILPDKWYPGLKHLVRWDVPVEGTHVLKEKMVDVEKYEEPGSLYVHFFSDDLVRIVVTNRLGGSSKHPILPPIKPAVLVKNEK